MMHHGATRSKHRGILPVQHSREGVSADECHELWQNGPAAAVLRPIDSRASAEIVFRHTGSRSAARIGGGRLGVAFVIR
jgi:hypothetical protein